MEKTIRSNNQPLESNDEKNNREVFEKMLKIFSPDLFYVYDCLNKNAVSAQDLAEVAHKIGIVKRLDDGYGKIVVEMQKRNVFRIRLLQDKIIKAIKDEKILDE